MDEVNILNDKTKEKREVTYNIKVNDIVAPIKNGDEVGEIEIIENNKVINKVKLTVKYDVDKANILIAYYRNLKNILNGF